MSEDTFALIIFFVKRGHEQRINHLVIVMIPNSNPIYVIAYFPFLAISYAISNANNHLILPLK